jgi:hypothetical protein
MTLSLIPYVQVNGAYSLPDTVMVEIFHAMKKNDLLQKVFYRGEVKTSEAWLEVVKRKANLVHTIWDIESKACLMIAWLNNFDRNSAFAHFCILPEGWRKNTVELGKMCLKHWFDFKNENGERLLDVVVGKTPDNNRAATIYLRRVGMKILGTIPMLDYDFYAGEKIGSVFSYITQAQEDLQNGQDGR